MRNIKVLDIFSGGKMKEKRKESLFMNKNYKKHEIVSYVKGFAIGYFLVDIVCWFFKALAGKK